MKSKVSLFTMLVCGLLVSGCLVGGCSVFNPGGQTATARHQITEITLTEEGVFRAWFDGAQAGNFFAAGGPKVDLNPDGSINHATSVLTRVLNYSPSTEGITETATVHAQLAAQQGTALFSFLDNLVTTITPLLGRASAPPVPTKPVETTP